MPHTDSTPASPPQAPADEPTHKKTSHPRAAPKEPAKRRGPGFWALVVLGVAAAAWVVHFIQRQYAFSETDDAYLAGHVHMISSRLDGSVTEVQADENQSVKAGQVLARLDALGEQIALEKSRAALEASKADILKAQAAADQARAQEAEDRAQVAVAEAQVGQSAAELDLANVNNGRNERLFQADTRTISQSQVDTTRSAAAAAAANLAAAKASLLAAGAKVRADAAAIESAEAQLASVRARVESDRQSVRDAERELSYTTITAPSDGRIGNKNVEVGNRVQVGQSLFALVDADYWVTANFKETQLRGMAPGQPVEVTIDAVGSHVFTGRVQSIAPATGAQFALLPADNATGNFTKVVQRVPVKIVFDPASVAGFEDRLRPGLSAVVSVKIR